MRGFERTVLGTPIYRLFAFGQVLQFMHMCSVICACIEYKTINMQCQATWNRKAICSVICACIEYKTINVQCQATWNRKAICNQPHVHGCLFVWFLIYVFQSCDITEMCRVWHIVGAPTPYTFSRVLIYAWQSTTKILTFLGSFRETRPHCCALGFRPTT